MQKLYISLVITLIGAIATFFIKLWITENRYQDLLRSLLLVSIIIIGLFLTFMLWHGLYRLYVVIIKNPLPIPEVYYHAEITYFGDISPEKVVALNLKKEKLIEKVMKPFNQNQAIRISGYRLWPEKIGKYPYDEHHRPYIALTRTRRKISNESSLSEEGEDVTNKFLIEDEKGKWFFKF